MNNNKAKEIFELLSFYDFFKNQEIRTKKEDITPSFNNLFINLNYTSISSKIRHETVVFFDKAIESNIEEDFFKSLKTIKKRLFKNNTDYRYLLASELIYERAIIGKKLVTNENKRFLQYHFLKSKSEKTDKIDKFFRNLENKAIGKNELKSLQDFELFIDKEKNYEKLSKINIAICATMSSGKSTFVNALLGNDVLPSRNEATTAKITSIYDKDDLRKLYGFCEKDSSLYDVSSNVDLQTVDKWNYDSSVSHIYLQGDLDKIGNKGKKLIIHDTPGTNNSGDKNHQKITYDFLSNNELDAIIYVANVEHTFTNDENILLKYLVEIEKNRNVPILFILNKADSLDITKETITNFIQKYKVYLEEIGFKNTEIYPVSSKAARLLKMALNDKSGSFSEDELDDFNLELKRFSKKYDFSGDFKSEISYPSKMISIDNNDYDLKDISLALDRTGISKIEKIIENFIQNK